MLITNVVNSGLASALTPLPDPTLQKCPDTRTTWLFSPAKAKSEPDAASIVLFSDLLDTVHSATLSKPSAKIVEGHNISLRMFMVYCRNGRVV